jgi:hypothetical protein
VLISRLNLFKFINIIFREEQKEDGEPVLFCEVQLTPLKRQSYNVFLEGTNNSGNIGVGGNFAYNHRNLFHGGENLTLSVWGALKKEKLKHRERIIFIFPFTEHRKSVLSELYLYRLLIFIIYICSLGCPPSFFQAL